MLQLREALDLVEGDLRGLSASLADLARRHRDTPVIGRSNLQQAVPVTFGYKMAGLLSAVERHRRRLDELRPRLLVGQFAGAAGTLASLPEGGLETQRLLMVELGLGQPDIAWHTQRDAIAEVGCFLGLVGGTLGKFATDVKLMMQTEVAEVYEPFAHGRGSSSTMPQKRNPVSCIYIHAAVAAARPQVTALLEAVVAEHERSAGPWQIEWAALPQICCLMAGALAHARFLAAGLEVDVPRMRANLDLTHGLVVSEAVMMGLAPISAASVPTTWSTTSAARRSRVVGRWSSCWPRRPRSPTTWTGPPSTASAIPPTIWAWPGRWSTGCWPGSPIVDHRRPVAPTWA